MFMDPPRLRYLPGFQDYLPDISGLYIIPSSQFCQALACPDSAIKCLLNAPYSPLLTTRQFGSESTLRISEVTKVDIFGIPYRFLCSSTRSRGCHPADQEKKSATMLMQTPLHRDIGYRCLFKYGTPPNWIKLAICIGKSAGK